MTDPVDPLRARLHSLRESFDRSFAEPLAPPGGATVDLLAVRVRGEPYVLCASEVEAVQVDRVITPVPSRNSELLGIVGMRGIIVAVYDLAALLGVDGGHLHRRQPDDLGDARRWLALAKGSALAFAFDAFEGQLRVEQLTKPRGEARSSEPLGDLVHVLGVPRRLVRIEALVLALGERAQADYGKKAR